MEGGVHVQRAYNINNHSAMSISHAKLHSAGAPALVHSQAHTNSSYSFQSQPSSRSSDTTQGTAASTLFPPPASVVPASGANNVRPTENVMNKVGDKDQSLFQICVLLRQRLGGVPDFMTYLDEEEQVADEDTDPVTILWRVFRLGYPLLALYNVLRPDKPIQPDLSGIASEVKRGKAMTFKFLNVCINDLKFKVEDCFIILDLFGDDTTGFVRVTKTITRLLDILVEKGMIEDTRRDSAEPCDGVAGGKRSQRQHIVDELVNTERTYVQQLELLQGFQVQCQKTGVIPGDVIHKIFLNLNGLLDFQRRFLIRVEQINAMPESEQNWGKLFVLYNDAFTIYEPYITNQKQCEETVMREFESLQTAGGTPELQGIVATPSTLYSFLMKPFQRLSKYPLLLDSLYKKGDLNEERKHDLLIGKECATAVLTRTNAAMEREERLVAVEELRGRVEDWKGHQVDQFGELLLYGLFTVIKSDNGPSKDTEREYHVYFFESILLCCKDIDPNKAKNKIKGRSLVDRKGKPKLQLKGRIFMQNVTDIVAAAKQATAADSKRKSRAVSDGLGSYTCQIFWKGDPGIENFTIRFMTDDMMQKWYAELVKQKQGWSDRSKNVEDRPTMTSATEFISMQGQHGLQNPYQEEEDDGDEEPAENAISTQYAYDPRQSNTSDFASGGWVPPQTASRSRAATDESGPPAPVLPGRQAVPRLPHGSMPAPALTIRTQHFHGAFSPSDGYAGDSYFSPTEETPSARSSASSGMYFPRQGHFSEGGYPSPHPYRSGSREVMNQQGYPASQRRPGAYASGGGMPAGFTATRNRSVSSPSINDAQRRDMESNRPPMPASNLPTPNHYPPSFQRSQTNSPHISGGIDERLSGPMSAVRGYHPSPSLNGFAHSTSSRSGTPASYRDPLMSPNLASALPIMSPTDNSPPAQLKVKVHAPAAGQVLTLVVPSNITYHSLKDRIDAKLTRSTNISLTDRGAGTQVKLKYLDEDDYVNIASDEDVQTAFETWREQKGAGVTGMGEIELYCQ